MFSYSKIIDNLESSEVKNLFLSEYSEDCSKHSESSSLLEHIKHRLGPCVFLQIQQLLTVRPD